VKGSRVVATLTTVDPLSSYTTFGELLHFLRRSARLSQRELATAVGYSESMMSRLEHGERPPDVATIHALFVPALGLEGKGDVVARLTALAQAARGEKAPKSRRAPTTGEPPTFTTRHRLPRRLTSFIGRTDAEHAIIDLLTHARLVTLTGPGGCGKTSLAVETARRIAEGAVQGSNEAGAPLQFDAIYFVELLPLSEGDMLAQTVLMAMDLEGNPEQPPRQTLVRFLADQSVLLILDNCEHLVDHVAELAEVLLRDCLHLHILTTSRERLNIGAESVYLVGSLAYPDAATDLARIAAYPAVQVFVERSKAITPSFHVTPQNAGAILRICQLLDGIPLALELGAAATATFSVEDIAGQLGMSLLQASRGYRTADPRHHTLHDTVEWSYRLLAPAEQRMLVHLAVFAGGWTLEAMQQVIGGQGDCVPLLHRLVQKSLVRVEQAVQPQGSCTRYYLLRAIHEFASHKLAVDNVQADIRLRHFDFYTQLAMRLGNQVLGARHRQAMAALDADYHNTRAAVQFSLDKPLLSEARLRAAASLPFYWQLRSATLSSEGVGWLDGIHDTGVEFSNTTRAQVYTALLHIKGLDLVHQSLSFGGRPLEIQALIDAADALVAPCLAQGDWRTAAYLLLALAGAHRNPPELYAKYQEYTQRALELMQKIEDPRGIGFARIELAALDALQDQAQAIRPWQEENFRLLEQTGSTWALCEAYRVQAALAMRAGNQAEIVHNLKRLTAIAEREEFTTHLHQGYYVLEHYDEELAMRMAEDLLERQRVQQDAQLFGLALHQLGRMCVHRRQFERAAALLDEAIDYWRRNAGTPGLGSALQWSLIDRGRAAYFLGDHAMALRCYDESTAIFAASPYPKAGAFPLFYRGHLWMEHGDLRRAQSDFCLSIQAVSKDLWMWARLAIRAVAGLAEAAYTCGNLARAGTLFGAVAQLNAEAIKDDPFESRARFGDIYEFRRDMAAANERRQNSAFEAAWQEGSKLTLPEAIAIGLTR
jgi:predicted ATPase